jgi:hypothetical protein
MFEIRSYAGHIKVLLMICFGTLSFHKYWASLVAVMCELP